MADGIFVLIAAGSSYVFHGDPINKAEDTNKILQREKYFVPVNTVNSFKSEGFNLRITCSTM